MASNIKGITVEIGGDTGPLDKALKDVNTTSRNLQSELKQVSRSLKFDPSSTEMLSQKQKVLSESIENTKNKLEILKQAEAQVKEQFNNGEIGEEKYRAFEREIENTENKLKNLEKEFNASNPSLQAFGEKAGEVGEKLKTTGEKMQSVGTDMTAKVTAPIIAGFGVADKAAMDFDHQMADIQKEIAAKGENVSSVMSKMSSSSLKWSMDFGQSTDSINEGLLTLVKDGYNGSEAMSIMQTSLYTARGANEDLATVVDKLGSSLEAYGMKTDNAAQTTQNAAHMADTFAYIANHTKASITSLGEAFSVVGATANSLKQPMAQTASAIGILESNGIDATTAATSLQAGLVNLTKPTTKMKKALDEMKFSAFDSKGNMKDLATILDEMQTKMSGWTNQQKEAAIATIFGKESLASWNVLMHKGGDYLKDLSTKANGATGEVKKLSDSMKNTDANKFKEFQESAHAMAVSIGQEVLPVFTPIIEKITALIKSFSGLSPATKKLIVDFGLAAAATGPIILVAGTLVEKLGSIGTGISSLVEHWGTMQTKIGAAGGLFNALTKPITTLVSGFGSLGTKAVSSLGLFSSGIGSLGGKISTLITGPWKLLINGFKSLPGIIKNLSFTNIATKLITPFKTMPTLLKGIFSKIPSVFGIFKTALTGLVSSVVSLGPKILTGIKSAFSIEGIMNGAKAALGLFTSPWGALVLVIVAAVGAIIANWDTIKAWVTQHFGGTLPTSFKQFQQIFSQIWTTIQQVFTQVWNNIKNVVTQVWAYIGPTIIGAINQIKAFWNEVWPEIQQVFVEVWNVMKVILAPAMAVMYAAISTGIGLIKGIWGPAWNVLKDTLKTVWDAITGVIKVAWDIISGVIKVGLDLLTGNWSKAWNDFKSIFSNTWNDLGKLISNIANDALKWGSDIIDGIVKGIKGAMGGLTGAVSDVANKIRSFLHFSVPDEGPLTDYESWMPDFMEGLAKGIDGNIDVVNNSLIKLSSVMANAVMPERNTRSSIFDSLAKGADTYDSAIQKLSHANDMLGISTGNSETDLRNMLGQMTNISTMAAIANNQYQKLTKTLGANNEKTLEALKNYQDYQKSYAETAQKVADAEQKIKDNQYSEEYEKIDADVKKLTADTDDLQSKLDNQYDALDELQLKGMDLDTQYKELVATYGQFSDQAKDASKAIDDNNQSIQDLGQSIQDTKDKMESTAVSDLNNLFDKLKSALKNYYDDEEKEDEAYWQQKIDNNSKWKEDTLDNLESVYNAQKDAIEKQKTLLDRQESDEDDADKIAADKKILDMNYSTKAKADAQADLNSILKEQNRRHQSEQLDDQETSLENQYNADKANIEKVAQANEDYYNSQIDSIKAFYENKEKEANLDAEAQQMIVQNNQTEIVKLLKSYGEDYEMTGASLGERLVAGFKQQMNSIQDIFEGITAQANSIVNGITSTPNVVNAAYAGGYGGYSSNSGASTMQQASVSNTYGALLHADKIILNNSKDVQQTAEELAFYTQQALRSKGGK